MITKQNFEQALSNLDFFTQGLIYTIIDGKDTPVNDTYVSFSEYIESLPTLITNKTTFKIQGFEAFNKVIYDKCNQLSKRWGKPVDCHAYWGYEDHGSFDMHSDPCEVCIYICEGTKTVTVADTDHTLKENEHIFIKANTQHKAFNITNCLSLSFGTYNYLEKSVGDIGIHL